MTISHSKEDVDAAHRLAQLCADAMWRDDHASRGLGMEIRQVGPGEAVLAMTVRPDMVNGHDICHGGFIFTLADSAFAYACNTYNQVTVAAGCEIIFVKSGRRGQRLVAHGREVHREGRSGVYDIEVKVEGGETIALFRGRSRTIKGEIIPGAAGG